MAVAYDPAKQYEIKGLGRRHTDTIRYGRC